ncbi:MAG: class I SAM-dependent methyltransferase [Marinagarivorans sp.]|nr:class I SAM-dependent methyltransferase [Marinagarivorans sp.]
MATATSIFSALSARAYAQQSWPELGFHDRAARLLARLLGVNNPVMNDPLWERDCLVRSQWFDARCRRFFTLHPQGMCIDLGAGLSTRFHRLSEADDWPRFSWVDVDLPDVTAIKTKAIPKIDNYQLIAANIVQDDWLAATGWHPHTPLIITLESVLSDMSIDEIYAAFSIIAKHCTAASQIEIVFDYRSPARRWYEFFVYRPRNGVMLSLVRDIANVALTHSESSASSLNTGAVAYDDFFVCSIASSCR